MSEITRHPLCWPNNVPRTIPSQRSRPLFKEKTIAGAVDFLLAEIDRLNNTARGYSWRKHVIISSNAHLKEDGTPYSGQGEPKDPGVAVYFPLKFYRNGKLFERPIVLTCDKWVKLAWNLYAIAMDITAQRGRSRWGCTSVEQAFQGYLAIPAKCGGLAWWDHLEISPEADEATIKEAFRSKAQTTHPDKGGSTEKWAALQEAYEQAMARFTKTTN